MESFDVLYPNDPDSLAAFFQVASQVYQDDPLWVSQSELSVQRSLQAGGAGFLQPLVVVKNGRPLARAAAILLPGARDELGRPQGYIAFFECLPGFNLAGRQVLQACEEALHARGAGSIQAPRLDNLLMGLVIKGFDQPQTVLSPHNPPYYQDILLAHGYQVHETLCSYLFSRQSALPVPFRLPGIHTRPFDRTRLDEEVKVFNYLNNEIFRSHPGYVARGLEEDRPLIESFLPILDDNLVIIAETSSGSPVGLLVCLPDIYRAYQGHAVDSARLITIGAIPAQASKGVGVLMGLHLLRNLLDRGYQTLEASWIRSTNLPPQNLANRFKGRLSREFAVFEKAL